LLFVFKENYQAIRELIKKIVKKCKRKSNKVIPFNESCVEEMMSKAENKLAIDTEFVDVDHNYLYAK
jgi:hypothetical protein